MVLEGNMDSQENAKVTTSSFVKFEDQEIRVEKLICEDGRGKIRFSARYGKEKYSDPIILSETDLLELLHKAINAGVLPRNFLGQLRERMEI